MWAKKKTGLFNGYALYKENKVYFLVILLSGQLYLSIFLSMYLSICF